MNIIEILNQNLTGKKVILFEGYLNGRIKPLSVTFNPPVNAYDEIIELKKEILSVEIASKELREEGNFAFQLNFKDYPPFGFYANSNFSVV